MIDEIRTRADRRDAKRSAAKHRIPKHGRKIAEIYQRAWERRSEAAKKPDA